MKSILRSGIALVAAAVLGASLFAASSATVSMGNGNGNGNGNNGNGVGGKPTTAEQVYLDDIKDYGVCRGLDADCYHDRRPIG